MPLRRLRPSKPIWLSWPARLPDLNSAKPKAVARAKQLSSDTRRTTTTDLRPILDSMFTAYEDNLPEDAGKQGLKELASQLERKVEAKITTNEWQRCYVGILYMEGLQLRKASEQFEKARSINQNAAEPLVGLAKIYLQLVQFHLVPDHTIPPSVVMEFTNRELLKKSFDSDAQVLLQESRHLLENALERKQASFPHKDGERTILFQTLRRR